MVQELADYINLELPISWINCYQDVLNSYDANWLNKIDFENVMNFYELPYDFHNNVKLEINNIKEDDKLNLICYLMYYILFLADEKNYYDIWSWKQNSNVFKSHGSYCISLIALLSGCKFHKDNMRMRGFDEEQIKCQIENIRLIATSDSKIRGINGIRFSQMIWGSYFMKGTIIQLGRLQFEVGVKNFRKLDKYFARKPNYIYIHIPAGTPLLEKDVDDSLNRAKYYINKYYPEYNDKESIYFTETWLLSPEVKQILPSNSNIIKFQNMFNIMEYEENVDDFLNFIFNDVFRNIEYKDLPEDTILQKNIKIMLLKGEPLHLGIGVLKK